MEFTNCLIIIIMNYLFYSSDGQNKSHLQMNQVLIHANLRCSRAFSKKTINQTNICAGVPRAGKDLCTGDTGGPLMVPIVSFLLRIIILCIYNFNDMKFLKHSLVCNMISC